jgi:photosystem II stability/assembly factor-like uncharacterized protein
MRRTLLPSCLLLALLALRPAPALAHAGLPETGNVTVRRGHPEDLFVGASFGAVVSRDNGQSWRWLCPRAIGYGTLLPSAFLWREDGTLLTASGAALLRSKDGGCSWQAHPFFQGLYPAVFASHPAEPSRLWVATGRYNNANTLYLSDDGGESFTATSLRTTNIAFNALRVAPSDPRRLYLSGNSSTTMSLFRSDDAGATWQELPHTLSSFSYPYDLLLLHVAPNDPDHLWARVVAQGKTHLLESLDGGRTLKSVLALDDFLLSVETSADARTLWAATPIHLYRSRDGAPATPLTLPEGNACAYREGDTLYVCGSPWVHDWALARSPDEGDTLEPLFSFEDIQGVLDCPVGTPARDVCTPEWPQLRQQLGLEPLPSDGGTQPPPDAGTSEPPPPSPPPKGCSATGGLLPAAWLLTLAGLRRSRRHLEEPTR